MLEQVIAENTADIEGRLRSPFLPMSQKPDYAGVLGSTTKNVTFFLHRMRLCTVWICQIKILKN